MSGGRLIHHAGQQLSKLVLSVKSVAYVITVLRIPIPIFNAVAAKPVWLIWVVVMIPQMDHRPNQAIKDGLKQTAICLEGTVATLCEHSLPAGEWAAARSNGYNLSGRHVWGASVGRTLFRHTQLSAAQICPPLLMTEPMGAKKQPEVKP